MLEVTTQIHSKRAGRGQWQGPQGPSSGAERPGAENGLGFFDVGNVQRFFGAVGWCWCWTFCEWNKMKHTYSLAGWALPVVVFGNRDVRTFFKLRSLIQYMCLLVWIGWVRGYVPQSFKGCLTRSMPTYPWWVRYIPSCLLTCRDFSCTCVPINFTWRSCWTNASNKCLFHLSQDKMAELVSKNSSEPGAENISKLQA